METETVTDPFGAPGAIPSEFPTMASLRGRLVLIKPLKQETVPNNQGAPGQMQERVTANVTVVDGLGPVPVMNRGVPTGQTLAGPEFQGMWISQEVIVKQLAEALRTGGMVLGRVDTRTPGSAPGKGQPWGLIDPSEQDKQTARDYLAGRVVSNLAPTVHGYNPQDDLDRKLLAEQQRQAQAPQPHPFTPQAQAAPQYAAQAPGPNMFAAPPQAAPPNPAAGNPFA